MPLTPSQRQTLATHIAADPTLAAQPNNPDGWAATAAALNATAAPTFYVWRGSLTRSEVYHQTSPANTVFDWGTFKAQGATEQTAWTQMFMGDSAPASRLNFRDGVAAIFSGSGAPANMRAHIFASARRAATRAEKLFAAAPVATGGLSPSAANGNTLANPLGGATNPGVMAFEGQVSPLDVELALNPPA